jgi:phosphoribosylpyrophosphate synthetase
LFREKVRGTGDKRIVKIIEGDPRGRNVVIVDDAIMKGGTVLRCREALVAASAASVSAYATHGRFAEDSWRGFLNGQFVAVWITNSCPTRTAVVSGIEPFQIISLEESIARVITDKDGH